MSSQSLNGPYLLRKDWTSRLRQRRTSIPTSSPITIEQEFLRSRCFRPAPKEKVKALQGQPVKEKPMLSSQVNLKKRKREAAPLDDSPGSGESTITRSKLTQRNLELWNEENDRKMSLSNSSQSHRIFTPKQSYPTDISSQSSIRSSRSCTANSPLFEKTLGDMGVMFSRREVQPDKEDLKTILEVIQKQRDSPEPDRGEFYETLSLVDKANETTVTNRLTPLLIPFRDLPSNNRNTSKLLYRSDSPWPGFGSVCPRMLPVPQPDLVISFSSAAFTPEQKKHMTSPYKDGAGFYPRIICEVKTALQGPKVADRQNGNNAICALLEDYQFQQKLGHKMEGKIRLVTTAHNTRSQWYTVWFYILGADGKPEWCSKIIKHISFDIEEERGFLDARSANLNLCEHLQSVILPQLYEDLAEAARIVTSSLNGARIQPRLTSEVGGQTQTEVQRSTELHLPAAPTSSDRVSSNDLPHTPIAQKLSSESSSQKAKQDDMPEKVCWNR